MHCLSRRKQPSTGSWVPALNRTLGSYAAIKESRVRRACPFFGIVFLRGGKAAIRQVRASLAFEGGQTSNL
jgi:hypothetical protein